MVAGYCYNWDVAKGRGPYDIYLPYDFKARWNLKEDKTWAISPNSFEEVGCIHTAQGLEFDYVGVFIGKDLTYNPQTGKIETHREAISSDDNSSGIRLASTSDELMEKFFAEEEFTEACDIVKAMWSGVLELWAVCEESVRNQKRSMAMNLLLAWYLADMYPTRLVGGIQSYF